MVGSRNDKKKPQKTEAATLLRLYDGGEGAITKKTLKSAGLSKYLKAQFKENEEKKEYKKAA